MWTFEKIDYKTDDDNFKNSKDSKSIGRGPRRIPDFGRPILYIMATVFMYHGVIFVFFYNHTKSRQMRHRISTIKIVNKIYTLQSLTAYKLS